MSQPDDTGTTRPSAHEQFADVYALLDELGEIEDRLRARIDSVRETLSTLGVPVEEIHAVPPIAEEPLPDAQEQQ